MFRKLAKKFQYREKGFTLIELLVVVAILGVLAAIAVPNVAKFIGTGKDQAKATELHDIQTAVTAAMADAGVGSLTAGNFGNTAHEDPPTGTDLTVATGYTVGGYVTGGAGKVQGAYSVAADGAVSQTWYP